MATFLDCSVNSGSKLFSIRHLHETVLLILLMQICIFILIFRKNVYNKCNWSQIFNKLVIYSKQLLGMNKCICHVNEFSLSLCSKFHFWPLVHTSIKIKTSCSHQFLLHPARCQPWHTHLALTRCHVNIFWYIFQKHRNKQTKKRIACIIFISVFGSI